MYYSNAMRNATAVAHGANASESRKQAPSNDRFASLPIPAKLLVTAPAPKISTGTKEGKHQEGNQKAAPAQPKSQRGTDGPNHTQRRRTKQERQRQHPQRVPAQAELQAEERRGRTTGKPEITQCAKNLANDQNHQRLRYQEHLFQHAIQIISRK
jgi:hypothetical protein